MTEKKKRKRYTVQFKIDLFIDEEILAESLEDAIAQAKEYDVRDVVTFTGGYNDGAIELTGAFS